MFKDDSNLSPDYEWILLSGQVDDRTIIEYLARQYYQQIYLHHLSELAYPEEAERAAVETFVEATLRAQDYNAKITIFDWLVFLATGISQTRRSQLEDVQVLNPKLIRAILREHPEEELRPCQIERGISKIRAQVGAQRSAKSNRARFQVLFMTGITVLAVFFLTTFSSLGFGGTSTRLSTSFTPTPSSNIKNRDKTIPIEGSKDQSRITASLPKLTIHSDQNEILSRIQSSTQLWSTLWVDLIVTFHGPAGYVGPSYSERHQLWIDQEMGGLLVSGPTEGFPNYIEKIFLSPRSPSSQTGLFGAASYLKLGSQYPWFSIKSETAFQFPYAANYLLNTINQELFKNFSISTIDKAIQAERNTIIVELTSEEGVLLARLWLETESGIVLREQYFDPHSSGKIIIESTVSKIDFDHPRPTMWKRPKDSTFVLSRHHQEGTNQPAISGPDKANQPMLGIPFRTAPANFDPSESRLSLFKADRMDYDNEGLGIYHLFADNFFLGDIELINPLQMICDRSPDGLQIIFSDERIFPPDSTRNIYLIDLKDLNLVSYRIPSTNIIRLSFSPDNRTVAVVGYDGLSGQDRFYLIDTSTRKYDLLPIHSGFVSVAWSPDGKQIAVIDQSIFTIDANRRTTVHVYNVQNGDLIDKLTINGILQEGTNIETPLVGWRAKFQIPLQDLSYCITPP